MHRGLGRGVFEELPQAISNFLADRAAVDAVNPDIRVVGQSRHEIVQWVGFEKS
jgi:hypothetical protein